MTVVVRPSCLPGVELIQFAQVRPSLRFVSPSYMAAVLRGSAGHFRYRTQDFTCRDGAVNLLDPEEVFLASHQPHDASATLTHLLIAPELILRAHEEAGGMGHVHLAPEPENGELIAAYLARLDKQIRAQEAALGIQQTWALLLELLYPSMAPPLAGRALGERRAVARARERLRAQLDECSLDECSLDDLAAEVGLTKAYLVRVFAREVGLPPHEYQMHLRVARATRLLAKRLPAGEIAHSVGFYDQSHLNRWFKKVLGVTPGQYARASV